MLALLVGIYVWRRPQTPERFIWLAAVCLGMRCLFEAVMTPYYLAPPLILALAIASRQGHRRFWAASVLGLETTVFAYHTLSPWAWWLPVVAGMVAVLTLGYPNKARTAPGRISCLGAGRSGWPFPATSAMTRNPRPIRSCNLWADPRPEISRVRTYSGPIVCLRPGSISLAVASVAKASATTDRVAEGSMTASTNPRSEAS